MNRTDRQSIGERNSKYKNQKSSNIQYFFSSFFKKIYIQESVWQMRKRKKRREKRIDSDLEALVEARVGSLEILDDLRVRVFDVALEMVEARRGEVFEIGDGA